MIRFIMMVPAPLLEEAKQAAEEDDIAIAEFIRCAIQNQLVTRQLSRLTAQEIDLILDYMGSPREPGDPPPVAA